ncbi:MAG: hypothetical protein K6L73_07465 [Cellvibrionaceae bacterium]
MKTKNRNDEHTLLNLTDDMRTFADDLSFICDALSCLLDEFSTLDKSSQAGAKQHLENLKFKADILAIETKNILEQTCPSQ